MDWLKHPGFFGTHATIGADVSQLMATFFTGLFVIGWIQARKTPSGCSPLADAGRHGGDAGVLRELLSLSDN